MKNYDVIVIGSGCGTIITDEAVAHGFTTALVDRGPLGGTCLNVGCIPSKMLIYPADRIVEIEEARKLGVEAEISNIDFKSIMERMRHNIRENQAHIREGIKQAEGLDFYEGEGHFTGDYTLEVNGEKIKGKKIFIASGSRPFIPPIKGLDGVDYLTNETVLELKARPDSIIIIGGGYIGAELAQMFARAGVKVTLVFRSRLLPEAEPEIGAALTGYFADEGITLLSGIAYRAICKTENGIALDVSRDGQNRTIDADQVLISTGRTPNIEGLGLTERGIAVSPKGGIVVDDRMRTTGAGIYAAGDVTGRDQFVYMAAYGAKLAAKNALNGDSLRYDNSAMPAIVFTDPQVASVGLTEATARAAGHTVRVSTIGLDQVPRALAARDTRGLIKLVADAGSGRLLGAHILAPEGADSIQTAAIAIRQGLTVDDLVDTIFPYLTTVEGLKLAALSFGKDVAKLSCCAG